MIKKLRKKLVITAMVSLLFVLWVIEGSIGVLNYRKIVTDADRVLGILEQNEGRFPEKSESEPPEMQKPKGMAPRDMLSVELPYESRFFSVVLNEYGEVVATDTGKIASVDTAAAAEYAKEVWNENKAKGFVNTYRYLKCEDGTDSEVRIIFLDRSRELSGFQNLLMTGLAVTVLGMLAVLVLMVLLSAHITRPFLENYEKQKRFITDAGHELKTPLTIIDADAEVLEMDLGENEWLHDIQTQSRRMADLTNDLILLSRMEENRHENVLVEFPLSDMVEETVHTFRTLVKAQNKYLTEDIMPMIAMYGDEKALHRLVMILLDNAVKYTNDGGQIKVSLQKQKKRICLTVFNTTEEMKREHLPHLFDRFYRTDGSRNSRTGGYGLGLSIAAATVEAHKGKISASTEDEKSLKITVTFPVRN